MSPTKAEIKRLHQQVDGVFDIPDAPINYSVAFAAGDNWSFKGGYYLEGHRNGGKDKSIGSPSPQAD